MKQTLTTLIALLVIQLSFSQEKINWMTWKEAIAQAEKDSVKKKMFIDVYTDWCGWCKRMDATTFSDEEVAKHINTYYYPVKLDAERKDTIVYAGNTFANSNPDPNAPKRKGVHMLAYSLLDGGLSYPSYVILDENQARVTIIKGYKKVDEFLASMQFFTYNQHVFYKQYLDSQAQKQLQKQNNDK